jgi:hypothetical protein
MGPVHFSSLKHMSQSPLHYRYFLDHPVEETRGMRVGAVAHAIVLGGRYHACPHDRRAKGWREFQAAHDDGATIVTPTELADANAIAEAVKADPVVRDLLRGTYATEQDRAWKYLGRDCAGRIDILAPDFLADLKVSNSAQPGRFGIQSWRMYYHAQIAWYLRGVDRPLTSAGYMIVVEDEPPYPVVLRQCTQSLLETGEQQYHAWMETLLCCELADRWPGYAESVVPIDVPT